MKLSIVDQSPVPAGATLADALRNTIDLARLADQLGYERYWIAEHHATLGFASRAPEVLLARVGVETAGIRIGSGGVLLPAAVYACRPKRDPERVSADPRE